jgi:outer membrane protein assembly factor BamB
MKAKKFFSGLLLLLALGLLGPGWVQAGYLTEKWTFASLPNYQLWGVKGSPAVGDDGIIYFVTMDGYLWFLSPEGWPIWRNNLFNPVLNTPAIDPQGNVVVHNGSKLYVVHTHYGPTWSIDVGANFVGAPAISKESIVYLGSTDSKLYAFDSYHNMKLWEHQVDLPPGSSMGKFSNPVIDLHGTIYCLYEATGSAGTQGSISRLYAIYPNNELKTYREFEGEINADLSPAIGPDGTIYVAGNNRLYALDPDTLNSKWELALAGSPTGSPVIGEPFNPAEGYSILVPLSTGLNLVGPPGHKHWTFVPEPALTAATPAVGKVGQIYFVASTYAVAKLHLITYATSSDDETYLLDTISLDGPTKSSPANVRIGNQNVVYVCENHSVSAWNNTVGGVDPGLARTSWPCDRGNLKRNGRVSTAFSALFSVAQLKVKVDALHLGHIAVSLGSKLDSARQSLEKEDLIPAKNKLNAFINEVRALEGKTIPEREAMLLTEGAQSIVRILQ